MMKKAVLGVAAMVFALGLTGCAEKEEALQSNAAAEEVGEETSTQENDLGEEAAVGFDLDRAAKNIVLEGKELSLPTTLDELGGGYTMAKSKEVDTYWGSNNIIWDLYYENKHLGDVWTGEATEMDLKTKKIFVISGEDNIEMSIDGISVGDNYSEVKERWGEPVDVQEDIRCYYYGGKETDLSRVSVYLDDDYNIEKFMIAYNNI